MDEEFTLSFQVEKGAGVAFVILYADGETKWHSDFAKGDDGKVVYTWKAPARVGEGTIYAQAGDPESGRKGEKTIPFRIVGVPGTC